jgi:hypothetical protein
MSTDPAELGYVFSPFPDPFSLGYAQLDVFLGQPGTDVGFVLLYAVGLNSAHHSFQTLPELLRTEHYWDEYGVLGRALQEVRHTPWWPEDASLGAVLGKSIDVNRV